MSLPTSLPTNIDATYIDDPTDPSRKAHQQHHDALHALYDATVIDDGAGNGQVAAVVAVVHGSTASTPRPSTLAMVHWVGSVAPDNKATHDEWTDSGNFLLKRWTGSAWVTLSAAVVNRGTWATSTAYFVGDIVTQGGYRFMCTAAHTAASFVTDLAASRWTQVGTAVNTAVSPLDQQVLVLDAAAGVFKPGNITPGLRNFGAWGVPAVPTNYALTNKFSDGSQSAANTIISYTALFPVDQLRLVYHAASNNNLSITMTDVATITAGVQNVFGGIQPVTFGGQPQGKLAFGGILISDPIPFPIPEGVITGGTSYMTFAVRTHIVAGAGGKFPCAVSTFDANEYSSSATDKSLSGTITGSTGYGVAPTMILGMPQSGRKPIVAAVGDSITAGTGDTAGNGYVQRALTGAHLPCIVMGTPSQTVPMDPFVNNSPSATPMFGDGGRFAYLDGATHVITEYGVNNINPALATYTLSQLQACVLNWATLIANKGCRVYQTTLTPHTTSSDGWVTTGNQAINNSTENTTRIGFNDWVRDGAPIDATTKAAVAVGTSTNVLRVGAYGHPLTGYHEIADRVETARNSGIWKAGYTNDGVHPNATGAAAAAPGIDTSLFTV